jgi:hypothetical protein
MCHYNRWWKGHATQILKKLEIKKCPSIFTIFILQFELHLQSYNKCWKCPLCSAMRTSTHLIMLLATLCRVSIVSFNIQAWIFCFSSSSECGLVCTHFLLNNPAKKLGGKRSGDCGGYMLHF